MRVIWFVFKVDEISSLLGEMILSVLLKQWAVRAMRILKV
jgi:hypothetical protein